MIRLHIWKEIFKKAKQIKKKKREREIEEKEKNEKHPSFSLNTPGKKKRKTTKYSYRKQRKTVYISWLFCLLPPPFPPFGYLYPTSFFFSSFFSLSYSSFLLFCSLFLALSFFLPFSLFSPLLPWPGESMRFTRKGSSPFLWWRSEMELDFIVMQRICSSSLESR